MASDPGSFWSTFGGSLLAPRTSLEQLLESPDVTIEAVLSEDEVIQEFKFGNDRLLKMICTVDACKKLVEFITCDAPEDASHERKFRYPFVSVELMTCYNAELFNFFMDPSNIELQKRLWNFLEATRPEDVNPVLAGYFSRVVAALLSRHMKEAAEYLREHGTDALFERFLERMQSRSLSELFAFLLYQEDRSQLIFPIDGLIMRLLSRLEDHGPTSDTQENITSVILELLAQVDRLCFGDELLRQLTSSQAIRILVELVFSNSAHDVAAASSILSSTILQSHVAMTGCFSASTCSLFLVPPLLSAMVKHEDDDLVTTDVQDPLNIVDEVDEATVARNAGPSSPTRSHGTTQPSSPLSIAGGSPGAKMLREVCRHFPRIRCLLDASLSREVESKPLPGGRVPAVGASTLEVMNLLSMLMRTGSEEVFEAMEKEQLLPRCLELVFRHPWNSLLHNSVRLMMQQVMSSTDGVRPRIILRLVSEGGLIERLVKEYRSEELYYRGERKKHPRVGYMGHLYIICTDLRDFGACVPECGTALEAVTGWRDVVLRAIDKYAKIMGGGLGGGIPDGIAGLASSGGFSFNDTSPSKTEDEFVLDDLGSSADGGNSNKEGDGTLKGGASCFNAGFTLGSTATSPQTSEQPWVVSLDDGTLVPVVGTDGTSQGSSGEKTALVPASSEGPIPDGFVSLSPLSSPSKAEKPSPSSPAVEMPTLKRRFMNWMLMFRMCPRLYTRA